MALKKRVRVLHLEDDPDYAELARELLEREGLQVDTTLVASRGDFEAALRNGAFDLILADYLVPQYDGLQALQFARERCPETPFLLVSGTIGEHAAIESLKAGARDYVLKLWPERLGPAVRRAVEESAERIQRHQAEAELVRQEKYFQVLTENSLGILSVLNRDAQFLYTSVSITSALGYEPSELIGLNGFSLVHPEDCETIRQAFLNCVATPHYTGRVEVRCRHKDGSWRHFEIVGQNRLDDPEMQAIVINGRDISDRKEAEAQLRESERQYRLLFDAHPDPMWIFDQLDLRVIEVNQSAVQHYGFTRGEFLGMGLGDLCPPDDEETKDLVRHYLTDAEAVRGGRSSILRHRKKDGTIIDVELKWNPIAFGGRVACLAMANDITERTRTAHRDAALSKLGQNLSCAVSPGDAAEIIRSVADALFSWDVFTLDLYRANTDDIYSILKVDTDREGRRYVIPSEPNGWAPTPMARRVMDQGAQLILRTEPVSDGRDSRLIGHEQRPSASLMLVPLRGRAGTIGVLSVQSYTLNAYNEEELHRLQTLADHCAGALERIAAEQALHESQQRFRNLFEGSPDAIIVQDYSGHILDVNPAGCLLHGQTREQMLGRGFLETVPEERREEAVRGFSGLVDGSIKHHEGFCLGPGGNVVPVEMRGNRIEYDGQPAVLVHIRDMSAHRRLEDQLRQSQKMEAIGQLAGGVAHDFNNILTVIHGHGSLLLCAANLTGPPARSAQQIVQAAERAAALTRQLLAFSRRQIMQARRLDMNEVVTNMSRMLGRILGEDISVRLHYHSQPAVILGDSGMMEQVLLNLAVNARDAMPQGGVLTIKLTLTDHLSANTSLYPGAKPGSYVCLTVTDTGCGIPAANLTRVFEPFFTTKQAGKGTGLGLATVYGIVRQHQGWVDVQSEVDHGSTFRVYLPAMSHAPSANQDCPAENPVVGGKETILVVEDEDSVRELVCQLLKRHGYHILQASSGVKALELWKECREKVDLLLTDLVMPDRVNGRELAEQLWSDRPGLKVLFTSGYSAEVVGKDFVLQQGLNYLQKPYKPERLARAVRESLDAVN